MAATNNARGKPRAPNKSGSGPKSSDHTSESVPASDLSDLLTVTFHTKTGQIVKIEGVTGSGAHHELSDDEKAILEKQMGKATLEAIVEQAFEAGIACALGDEADEGDEDEPPESEKDTNLRYLLLRPLVDNSAAKRLLRRDVLNRAIVKTLIHHANGTSPRN
jgi:hypothetical protein